MMTRLSYAYSFPLVRAGGVFLVIVGMGLITGGAVPRFKGAALAASGLIAAVLTATLARQLAAPFGTPTALQAWSLIGAVALELALIPLAVRGFRSQGDRAVTLAVMVAVGVHFIPMALAFGPLMLLLALIVCLIGVSGLLLSRLPLPVLWCLDGVATLGVGVLMWLTGV